MKYKLSTVLGRYVLTTFFFRGSATMVVYETLFPLDVVAPILLQGGLFFLVQSSCISLSLRCRWLGIGRWLIGRRRRRHVIFRWGRHFGIFWRWWGRWVTWRWRRHIIVRWLRRYFSL